MSDLFMDLIRIVNILLVLTWFILSIPLYSWWASRPVIERLIYTYIPLNLWVLMLSNIDSIFSGSSVRVFAYMPPTMLAIIASVLLRRKIKHIYRTEDHRDSTESRRARELGEDYRL